MPVYLYWLSQKSANRSAIDFFYGDAIDAQEASRLGVAHVDDVMLLFSGDEPTSLFHPQSEDGRLSRLLVDLLVSFASGSAPNSWLTSEPWLPATQHDRKYYDVNLQPEPKMVDGSWPVENDGLLDIWDNVPLENERN